MSEIIGYNGKIAYVDLTKQEVKIKSLNERIARDYLGGAGLSAKLIYDLLGDADYKTLKQDPYSPVNPLVFATGPITGTDRPASGRYSVCAISPLTNIWGESTSGGFFCIDLRNSGFDAIVFTGKAKKPTYLYLSEGKFEFKDASKLWGKDTYETQEAVRKEHDNSSLKVACIGPAGEKLVRYACIMNDEGRAAGRCGMGAIMGSKNLKAIAIVGTPENILQTPNKKSIRELRKNINFRMEDDLVGSIVPKVMNIFGTNTYMDMGSFAGDVPAYYFTETEFPAELLTSKTLKEKYPMLISGCARCPLQCAKQTYVSEKGKEIVVDGPEYESMAAYGSLTGTFDSKPVILAHHYGNVYGIDTISSGVVIAFLMYLVENNIATKAIKKHLKEIKMEDIKWGNGDLILKLMSLINDRKGIGDLLAEGVKIMAEKLGVDPELGAHVKGLEIPMHDARAYAGQALSYMTACCGANHQKCDWFQVETQSISFPEYKINPGNNRFDITGREAGVITFQDIRAIDDSAVSCDFETPPKFSDVAKYISYATDFKYTPKMLLQVGERMTNIKRLISCNLGITREDDRLPKIATQILKSGPTEGVKLDLEKNLKTYYAIRGWDWKTGRPTEAKLEELRIIGDSAVIIDAKEHKIANELYEEMERRKKKYIPTLRAKSILTEDMEEYLGFITLFAQCEEDFHDEFGELQDGIQLAIKVLPPEQWYWIKLDKGNFSSGRGKMDAPTLTLTFRDQRVYDDIMNMKLNPVTAVLSNRLKVKPMGKVKIFQNFIGLYLNKFNLKF